MDETHDLRTIRLGDSLAESNHALKLTDGDSIRVLADSGGIVLPKEPVLLDEHFDSVSVELQIQD